MLAVLLAATAAALQSEANNDAGWWRVCDCCEYNVAVYNDQANVGCAVVCLSPPCKTASGKRGVRPLCTN